MEITMHRQPGVLLVDLVITVGLLAILSTAAVPTFRHLLLDASMTAQVNGLVHAVHLGKQSAHMRLAEVVMCPSPDGRQCVDDGQWQNGWLLFVNEDRDDPPRVTAGEATLAAGGVFARGHLRANRLYFYFRAATTRSTNGTFTFCDDRGTDHARALIISYTGRPRTSRRAPDGRSLIC
ncbi:MAG: hypothetical protein HKN81_11845 [Gammaproteobacteria bacterium]|nr:hypothetical protein [Gammaproteobacteria bacterium]